MYTRNKYCCICGSIFLLPTICNPVDHTEAEEVILEIEDPYDSRVLSQEKTLWLEDFRVIGNWAWMYEALNASLESTQSRLTDNSDEASHSNLQNASTLPGFFISGPASWSFGCYEPAIPDSTGKLLNHGAIRVYQPADLDSGMLFPIHMCCFKLMQRICEFRKEQQTSKHPQTTEAFCNALCRRYDANGRKKGEPECGWSYANSGGLEWDHGYYDARQFWADGWDTEPGWELLCADPLNVSELSPSIPSQMSDYESMTSSETPRDSDNLAARLGWLFPGEVIPREIGDLEPEKVIAALQSKPRKLSADEGEDSKILATIPIGLINRLRIWSILEGIEPCEEWWKAENSR